MCTPHGRPAPRCAPPAAVSGPAGQAWRAPAPARLTGRGPEAPRSRGYVVGQREDLTIAPGSPPCLWKLHSSGTDASA